MKYLVILFFSEKINPRKFQEADLNHIIASQQFLKKS